MTDKIYHRDAYLRELDAEVVRTEGNTAVFAATIFAPEAGGQPCDLGTIGGLRVKNVTEKDGEVLHEMEVPDGADFFRPGQKVKMELDWERRFDHMQNHLGEHMLSALFKREYDGDNKGFHLGEDVGCFDIALKEITPEMLRDIEHKANRAVYASLPVSVILTGSAEEASSYPLRKPLSVDGEDILVVTVEGLDCCACCCPHPSDTSQVGIIKILRTEKYKGMTRVYYKCGMRALLDYEQKHDVVTELSEKYSADEFTLLEKEKIADRKHEELRRELNRMKDRFAELTAEEVLAESGEDNVISREFESETVDDLKRIAKKLTAKTDRPVILSSEKNLCVFMTHTGKSSLHCGAVVREFAAGSGGKGGGSDTQAQAVFNNADTMRNFILIARASV